MRASWSLPLAAAALAVGAWALLASQLNPVLLPGPLAVLQAAWDTREGLLEATVVTGLSALVGLLLAVVLGMLGATLFQLSRWVELALTPYALLVQTVPIVAVAPLLVVWLGYGPPVAVASAAIVSFFPVLTSANLGLAASSTEQRELFAITGASPLQTLLKLRLPMALPYLFGALRTAGGLAVIGAIVGEFVGANGTPRSLGYLVQAAARGAHTDRSFAAILAAAALALGIFGAIRALEHRAIGRWHGR